MNVAYSESAQAYVVDLTNSDQEYEFELPAGTKAVRIQMRDTTDLRFAFASGKVAGSTDPYHTLKGGNPLFLDKLYFNGNTLYLAAGGGSKVVEVLCLT